jgi:molecular chaperone GrpE
VHVTFRELAMTEKRANDQQKTADGKTADETEAEAPEEADEGAAEAEVPVEEDEAGTAAEAAATIAKLETEKAELAVQSAQHRDRWLRAAADFENFRKRSAKQETEAANRARADTLRSFLPVVDNVERALAYTKDVPAATAVAEGLRLVVKSFFDAFAGLGLQRFESLGQPFDPALHEAVGQIETADKAPGTIVQEMESGYLLKDKLLRPALVAVARPPKPAAAEPAAADGAEGEGAKDEGAKDAPAEKPVEREDGR